MVALRRLLPVAMLAFAACSGGTGGFELEVRVRTDLVPGVEFDSVEVSVDGGDAQRSEASLAHNFVSGRTVLQRDGVPESELQIRASLWRAGTEIMARDAVVVVSSDTRVTLVFARDCMGVSCPMGDEEATECHGGSCTGPRCTAENAQACPEPECQQDADCPGGSQGCLQARCADGVCLIADSGECGIGQFCDQARGCIAVEEGPSDGGAPTSDAGVDAGPLNDAGADAEIDAGFDAGPPVVMCGSVLCEPLEYCDPAQSCRPFPACFSPADCPDTASCRNRRCIPNDVDVDGDGVTAETDCDEQRATTYPGADERCNLRDDDCDEAVDEGEPGPLCAFHPEGGECSEGVCSCPPDRFDVDGEPDGCECEGLPHADEGQSCLQAIDLGAFDDTGQMTIITGNVLPAGRSAWYRFRAIDAADTLCDNFHVRARFTANPDDAFRFEVTAGSCGEMLCPEESGGLLDMRWATDFQENMTGECPCFPAPAPGTSGDFPDNQNYCNDNSSDFYIRVFRRAGIAPSCAPFAIEVSNGVYDSP